MMSNFSLILPSMKSVEEENQTLDNDTLHFYNTSCCDDIYFELTVTTIIICVPCIVGLLGNGAVIGLLGFCLKRTPVTTYILNLAVADFGVLIFGNLFAISVLLFSNYVIYEVLLVSNLLLYHFMFSISEFLLTIISMDRCVSVLFPIWYRCHRPEKLSTILCALIWIFGFFLHAFFGILDALMVLGESYMIFSVFWVNAVVCLPLITTSSLILVVKFCFKRQQRQRGKLLRAILLSLFFFLFFAFPLNFMFIMNVLFSDHLTPFILLIGYLFASINSLVNPLIYFLVGRKKSLCSENLKLVFQRLFKQEEETYGEELQLPEQTTDSAPNCPTTVES